MPAAPLPHHTTGDAQTNAGPLDACPDRTRTLRLALRGEASRSSHCGSAGPFVSVYRFVDAAHGPSQRPSANLAPRLGPTTGVRQVHPRLLKSDLHHRSRRWRPLPPRQRSLPFRRGRVALLDRRRAARTARMRHDVYRRIGIAKLVAGTVTWSPLSVLPVAAIESARRCRAYWNDVRCRDFVLSERVSVWNSVSHRGAVQNGWAHSIPSEVSACAASRSARWRCLGRRGSNRHGRCLDPKPASAAHRWTVRRCRTASIARRLPNRVHSRASPGDRPPPIASSHSRAFS